MKKIIAFMAIGSIFSFWLMALGFSPAESPKYVPGEILVKYSSTFRENASRNFQRNRIKTLKKFRTGTWLVKLPEDVKVKEALENYRMNPKVEYAEPNYYRYSDSLIPNDPYFSKQWGLHNTGQAVNGSSGEPDADIDAPEAWGITTRENSSGRNVVVAVIGTGIALNHPDLASNIWINPDEIPDDNIDNDGNGYVDDIIGWDFFNNRNNPTDSHGHETHISSIIAATGNDGLGMTGVCWNAKIIPLKISNSLGYSTSARMIAAIEYANQKKVGVINISFGGSGYSQAEKETIAASSAVVVCAAGNNGEDNDESPKYPVSYDVPNIIAVATTDLRDELAGFSNYGLESVDVGAPGVDIYGAKLARQTVWSENFDDGNIATWETGGRNNTWGTTDRQYVSGSYSLTDSPGRSYLDTGKSYLNNTESWVMTPQIDLSSHTGSNLEFLISGILDENDFLLIQTSKDGFQWEDNNILLAGVLSSSIFGSSGGYWFKAAVDLEVFDGEKIYLRFHLVTDATGVRDGYYIDDIKVTASSDFYTGSEYWFKNGTSVSAPFVAGIAALIKSQKPSLTNLEIINIIKNNVDEIPSLEGKVSAGGRVNLYKCLQSPLLQCGDGDVAPLGNRDGIINVGDALIALRFALELETPTQEDICHGDVAPLDANGKPNPDGQITVGDALIILRKALGLL